MVLFIEITAAPGALKKVVVLHPHLVVCTDISPPTTSSPMSFAFPSGCLPHSTEPTLALELLPYGTLGSGIDVREIYYHLYILYSLREPPDRAL